MVPGSLNKILDKLDDTGQADDIDALYETFADWAEESGRPLYPHQEDALLELLDGNHVIAQTPTGSGKSLIALAAHFISLARGGRSYYTAPLKALVSEKFFDLVDAFGAANVGMVTGDVALNPKAPIICCTAEILANQSLREGADLDTDMVIMDEFHFYGDPQRGWAWQVPLLELPNPQFVFLSATLGDTSEIAAELKERMSAAGFQVLDVENHATKGKHWRPLRSVRRLRTIAHPELSPWVFPCLTQLQGCHFRPQAAMPANNDFSKALGEQDQRRFTMYAVIVTGGKQYKVTEGEFLKIEKLEVATGEAVTFDRVLLIGNGDDVQIGAPVVDGAKVVAEVVSQGRHDKVRIIKFRRRKHHMKRQGHRQWFTEIKITGIQA